ncbi:MAG: putative zinc-binding protein [Candidatus Bathyarchaeia archaeon]
MYASKVIVTQPKILPLCYKVAKHENVVWVCGGATNVGQIGHAVGVLLTNMDKARMCCTTAVAAGSKPHLEIAGKAKKNIFINGCGNRCASKVLEKAGKRIDYEVDISKYLQKVPTLDIYQADVKKITKVVIEEAKL